MRYENVLQAVMKVAVGNNTLQYRHTRHDLPNVKTVDVSNKPLSSLGKKVVQFNRIRSD